MRLVPPVHLWDGNPTLGDPALHAVSFTPQGLVAVERGRAGQPVAWSRVGYLDVHLPQQPALSSWPRPLRAAAKRWVFGTVAHVHETEQRDVVVAWVSRPRADLLLLLEGVPPLGVRELNELLRRLAEPVDADEHERLASAAHWYLGSEERQPPSRLRPGGGAVDRGATHPPRSPTLHHPREDR